MQGDKLAIYGGKPIRTETLQYGRQWIEQEDINEVLEVLQSNFLTQGPKIAEFERIIANYVGTKYAVAFCNGTAALHGACFAAGITGGDEVITTPLTFAATSNSVLYQGGKPVFADVDEKTYLLDVSQVESKITERTKAIIPVDFTGQPVDMKAFRELADQYKLLLIQDAAHSLGASFGGKSVGSIADMTMFSFHPVKPVTTAEGGVIVTNSKQFYKRLQLFRSHGITKDEQLLVNDNEGPWYYEMLELGYNYRITDMQAALGIGQMKRLDQFINRRREIAAYYNESFASLEDRGLVKRPYQHNQAHSGWHLYILQLNLSAFSVGRKEIYNALRRENIGVNVHYIPVYQHPYYRELEYQTGICPVAERLYESFITLPLFPKMDTNDINDVVLSVEKVLKFFENI